MNARTVLFGVAKHSGADMSAHQMVVEEQERWSSIAQIAAEYETIAAVAQRDRWIRVVSTCGLTDEQLDSALGSDSFGPLTPELRGAEADGHDVDRLLRALVARRSLEDADDVGAVLISRLKRAALPKREEGRADPSLVVGMFPVAEGPMSPEMMTALTERQTLLESRASALAAAPAQYL